jgi:DNA polymerase-3 subunit gamma/tau
VRRPGGFRSLSSRFGTTERAKLARRKPTKSSDEPIPVPKAVRKDAGATPPAHESATTAPEESHAVPEGNRAIPEAIGAIPEAAKPAQEDGALAHEATPQEPRTAAAAYTVVARRYRPQRLEDVVGQDHVVRSLRNAIRLNRIAQAYLFCGTRGVGKTSMARIFAKCLNCVKGPTEDPCQTCDICESIALGQDVDVIEIDGASNNGVEQVRELRQNAALRPSRARYKIYYIDEVHMLSTGAFNALLKTLEEPPPHVKFLFATTEPHKIPITVLSRCQRYDFAGITPELIATALGEICVRERVEAEPEALQAVARRVGGSLRDAQSLLDRLLASGSDRLTVEVVHSLLGIASDERLLKMLEALADHDSAAALCLLEESSGAGVQPGDLLTGLIDFVRDAMVLATGALPVLLAVSPRHRPQLKSIVERWSLDSILAALQILSECRARMRGSSHGRMLVELAIVRVARLEGLTALGTLVERLAALESGPIPPRKFDAGEAGRRRSLPEAVHGAAEPTLRPAESPAKVPVLRAVPGSRTDGEGPRASQTSPIEQPAPAAEEPTRRLIDIGEETSPNEQPAPASGGARPGTPAAAGPRGMASIPTATAVLPSLPAPPQPDSQSQSNAHGAHDLQAPLDIEVARKAWPELVKKVGAQLGWRLSQIEPIAVEGPDVLVIAAKAGYNSAFDDCGTPEALAKIGQTLGRLVHRPVRVKYERSAESEKAAADSRAQDARRADSVASDPMVQRIVELFEARTLQLDYDDQEPAPAD